MNTGRAVEDNPVANPLLFAQHPAEAADGRESQSLSGVTIVRSTGYEAPVTVADAVRLMQADPDAKALAGGTDLLVQYRMGSRRPASFIDLKRILELVGITIDRQQMRLGAATAAAVICEHPDVKRLWPGLVEAVQLVGSAQIQGRSTVGGNLCNGSPAADTTGPLIVNRARAVIVGPDGERTVNVEDVSVSPGRTVLERGDLLVALLRPAPRTADAYLRLIPRTEMDIAVAGAAVSVTLDEHGVCTAARVAIAAVAPTVLLVPDAAQALIGSHLDDEALQRAGAAASAAARPIDDKRGTTAYRRTVVGVLTRRAATIAGGRASPPM